MNIASVDADWYYQQGLYILFGGFLLRFCWLYQHDNVTRCDMEPFFCNKNIH